MTLDPNFIFQPSLISNQDGKPSLIPTITILELLQSVMRAFPNPKLSNEELSNRDWDFRILKDHIKRGDDLLKSDYELLLNILAQAGYKLFSNPSGFEMYQLNVIEYLEALRDNDEEKYNKCVEYEKRFRYTDEQKSELLANYSDELTAYETGLKSQSEPVIEEEVKDDNTSN